jgi:hypothetical protein
LLTRARHARAEGEEAGESGGRAREEMKKAMVFAQGEEKRKTSKK